MNDLCSIELLRNAVCRGLSAEEETALHAHLEHCESCCAQMEQLAGGEAWQQEAADLLSTDELDAAVPEVAAWSEVDFSVEHLDPSDDANVLGQLGGYDVLAIVGRGGMGVVLKAFDRELKRLVAIKVLAPHLAHSSVARKRFAREAQAAAAVVNPHVIAIHHVQPTGRLPFLIMPLLTGESLSQRLKARGPLELTEVLRIGMQAATGLAAAHDQGLVHRDVKPANIFLEKGVERVVITDFGLARAADDVSMTRMGVVAGTPEYMSPEQARGEALDGRSDLFSLGCVLYEMATGVSPFRTDSTMATLRRIVDEQPAAMASLVPELPPWFCHIVERLLSKDPAQRFASASEVSQLLEQCLSHLQQPTSVPLPASLVPNASGRRSIFNLTQKGVFAMLGTIGMTLLGMVLWQQVPDVPDVARQSQEVPQIVLSNPGVEAAFTRVKHITIGQGTKIACSKDGKLIAVAPGGQSSPKAEHWKRTVEIWDAETGKSVASISLSTKDEEAILTATEGLPAFEDGPLAFSPDGTLLAVGTSLGQVKLFKPLTGELVLSLDDEPAKLAEQKTPKKFKSLKRAMGTVRSLAFSPDGTRLAMSGSSFDDAARNWGGVERLGRLVTGPGRLKVWEVKSGTLIHDLAGHSHVDAVSFSADGNLLATAGRWNGDDNGTGVIVWNALTGKKIRTITNESNGGTHAVVFSPTGNLVAIGSRHFDKAKDTSTTTVSLTHALSGVMEWQQTISGWAKPGAFSPAGKSLVVLCGGESIRFFDTESGTVNREIRSADSPQGGRWYDFALPPHGRRLAISGVDNSQKGTVEIWEFLDTSTDTAANLKDAERVPRVGAAFDAFSGRTRDKERLLKLYGGTAESEAAVRKGLTWIADQQQSDGAWSFWKSPESTGTTPVDESVAATAMALLAFQGAGNTHQSGEFKGNVRRGIEWLLKQQKENGEFPGATLYTHGLCLNVITELYGMSQDPNLHDAAKRAVAFAVESQNDRFGGWRYRPKEEADTSVTGWFVQGLTTARHASLDVPDQSFRLMTNYLDAAQRDEGESYPYVARGGTSQPGTTAIGLLCRQLIDRNRDTKGMAKGLARLSTVYGFDIKGNDYYYWYHASQALRNYGGPAWESWNDKMRSLLCAKQVPDGPFSGRWPPESPWGGSRGSIFTTCMAVLTLEVYYRHPSPFDRSSGK